ncbi:MAG: Asp-tRNA(Asn)/Glu-tRNA(Gln) amidotransferase subunit GatC [Candidatus Pacebacteria bacterium]|nr:Asp-tRNA(Asn)/Glu-tRNA(Gln) amidotransferase subunit GatC [Candidatus Paceibacterota bacterium]
MNIDHILKLARIEIKKEDKKSFEKDFSSILDFVKKIEKLKIKKTDKIYYPAEIYNVMREDKARQETRNKKQGTKKKLIDAAPDKKENYIKVKEILK